MQIYLSKEAAKWYEEELLLKQGDYVRFFARYGGASTIQAGFSLGVQKEEPFTIGTAIEVNGITYYIEDADLWYFDSKTLHIKFNNELEEPEFHYQ